ncbi:MAG: DUF2795 domain-containing protein [Catenulispora sp.]|nr:DUF2795 domain-containing protein [Catenulispora sp.]
MTEHRTSTKHSPLRDDILKHETEPLAHGGDSRAERWRQLEEERDEPERPTAPPPTDSHAGGTPPGMDAADVRGRSELARWLQPSAFPADRGRLLRSTRDTNAPDWAVEAIGGLPAGRRFENVQDVWQALGGGVEDVTHRS